MTFRRNSSFLRALSDGYATLQNPGEATSEATHAAIEEEEILSGRLDDLHSLLAAKAGQILNAREYEIYRAGSLFPARKTKLRDLTDRSGVSEARISQIGTEADRSVRAAIAADPVTGNCEVRFPNWRTIDRWCDCSREAARKKSLDEWSRGGDQNIDRVRSRSGCGN